ncbi:hypothetical protein [Pandoravirus japonicus]|uniref:Uncharacterized protein n=1 Tax=Pandoravirus japonicus TaxID=2823154 RepID=A0A811BP24_9VIRU|nr:hypothetical protein [Pandoravirus japonicus]
MSRIFWSSVNRCASAARDHTGGHFDRRQREKKDVDGAKKERKKAADRRRNARKIDMYFPPFFTWETKRAQGLRGRR